MAKEMQVVGGANSTDEDMNKINTRQLYEQVSKTMIKKSKEE